MNYKLNRVFLKKYGILLSMCICLFNLTLSAQKFTYVKTQTLDPGICEIILDTFYVLPSSIVLSEFGSGIKVPDSLYVFDINASTLFLSDSLCRKNISYLVSYKALRLPLNYTVFHKDLSTYSQLKDTTHRYVVSPAKPFSLYDNDGLIKQGSISRGLSLGNTQGGALQSSLDIRLSGKLNNDVDVLAVITDSNIPLQPEGNTQQLQEFDKVFIELGKNKTGLRVGDIDLNNQEGYFMKYSKKTTGGMFYTSVISDRTHTAADSSNQSVIFSGGISKGKFARNSFLGVTGNQGPYRLTGAENEMFIMILAGTERVYINGELMTRGSNYDYIIDYNTAELSFTAHRLITGDHRIIIEFEYSDKNYVRSLFSGHYEYTDDKAIFRLNIYSEQDARNQPLQQTLDEDDKFILQQAGDNPFAAIVPGWDSLGFTGDYVMYAMIDTLGYDSVFVYSVHPDVAVYKVSFSFVGEGKGNYVQDRNSANGRVFKWIQPLAGVSQGNHEPFIALVTPKKQQLITTSFHYKLSEKADAGVELALSNQDLNTFSSIDNRDNSGTAGRFFFRHLSGLKKDSLRSEFSLLKEISYEFTEARFVSVDRFRPVEFNREWNITANDLKSNDHIASGKITLLKNKTELLSLQSDYLVKSGFFNGNKNQLNFDIRKRILKIRNQLMYMNSDRRTFQTSFFKQKGSVAVSKGFLTTGCNFEQEINIFRLPDQQLLSNSYNFFEYEPFVMSSSDTSKILFRAWYKQRNTKLASSEHFKDAFISRETGARISTNLSSPNMLSLTGAYRLTNVRDSLLTTIRNDQTILSRLENNLNFFKGVITSFLYYEVGSGLESKKDFSYLEVAPGQGQYTWIDYNQNGVKELDEFEPANYPDEANFIRILLPSNDYIRTYTLQFSETFVLEPSRSWKTDSALVKKFVSRFSNRLQYTFNKKTISDNITDRFFPIPGSLNDTSLISVNSTFSNTVFFNRAHPVFNFRYRYSDNMNKSLLVHGFESRRIIMNEIQTVWNMTSEFGTDLVFRSGTKNNESELSQSRSFHIRYIECIPGLNYQPSVKHRYSVFSRYRVSENTFAGNNEKAVILSVGPEVRLPLQDKHTLHFRLTYHQITYNHSTSTPVAFEMLESLEPGKNFTWNLMLQYSVNRSLIINFMYEGRQPEGKKTIHFGTVHLKAML